MTRKINPYESPSGGANAPSQEFDWLAIWGWPIVFVANAVVPTLFGLSLLKKNGLVGLVLGCAFMLAIGWAICLRRPKWIRTVITGACLLMLSQLFPMLQVIIGEVSILTAKTAGLPVERFQDIPQIDSDFTSFVVTILTAAIHICLAAALGAVMGFVFGIGLKASD